MRSGGRRLGKGNLHSLPGPLLALASLLLYLRTIAPSLGGTIDSAEFQQATYSLSVVHPTGYPLYLLLGRLWITIFPFGDPAFRINLLSALFSALAVWVLYATVRAVTGNSIAGVVAAALFAVQPIPWAQASVAEINSFNTFLTGLAFLAAVLWASGRLPVPVFALAVGLAVSHHRTMLLYLPLLALFVLAAWRWGAPRKASPTSLATSVALILLPQVLYSYLPLRAHTSPWYQDCCTTWDAFRATMFGQSALPVIEGALKRPLLPRFRSVILGDIFSGPPGLWLVPPGLLGVALGPIYFVSSESASAKRPQLFSAAVTALFVFAFGIGAAFASLYDILDISDYLAVPTYMWSVLVGFGVAVLFVGAKRLEAAHAIALRVGYAFVLLLAAWLWWATGTRSFRSDAPRVDFSNLDRNSFWREVTQESSNLPSGSHLLADWTEANEARYLQIAEGWRPDLKLSVVDDLLANEAEPIAQMLTATEPVFLVGAQESVLSRFSAERQGPLWRLTGRQAARPIPPMKHTLNRRFGTSIVLLGYTLDPDPPNLSRGGLLYVTLYWKAAAPVEEHYVVFNHIIDANNTKIGQIDDEPGHGYLPTVNWKVGEVVADTVPIAIDPAAAPGTYRLMSGLYPRQGPARLQAYAENGTPLGDYPKLVTVKVLP